MPSDRSLVEREMQRLELQPFTLEGFHRRRERKQRNKRIRAGVVALVVAAVGMGALIRPFSSGLVPADDPRSTFLGSWAASDADGSRLTMTIGASGGEQVEIAAHDDAASVCSGAPSTMVGTGRLEGTDQLVISSPVLTCDDGSQPEALSGPPLQDQLRDLAFVHDPEDDVLTDSFGLVWGREGGKGPVPTPDPAASGGMWPQTGLEEVRRAQERADTGDPDYTWQTAPMLVGGAEPWGAEIFGRFLREELGWEEFTHVGGYAYAEGGGLYDELVFIRCAPGRTNPLYPDVYPDAPPEVRGCAPTIDDDRYETVMLTIEQPATRGPSGIWVVTGWEMLQPGASSSTYDHLSPDFTFRQFEQLVPPSDADVTAVLRAFLGARVDGEGAEQYVHRHSDGWDDQEVPVLYATTGGSAYERYEIDRLQGPVWPSGWTEFRIRLFAEDGTVVEQSFAVVRQENGRLGLMYASPQTDRFPTTEDGRPVDVPYSFRDGEVTFAAAPPWSFTSRDRTSMTLGGVGRGSASQFTMFTIVADPLTARGCEAGPAAADAEALVQSIRSNPDLETTAPVAVGVGGIDALQMDVAAPGQLDVGDCAPGVIGQLWLSPDTRMRLYVVDLPDGMSARTMAVAIVALNSEYQRVVKAAEPVLDSFVFHAR